MKGTFRSEAAIDLAKEKGIELSIDHDTLRNTFEISATTTRTDGSVMYSSWIIARANYLSQDLAEELVVNAILQIVERADQFWKGESL